MNQRFNQMPTLLRSDAWVPELNKIQCEGATAVQVEYCVLRAQQGAGMSDPDPEKVRPEWGRGANTVRGHFLQLMSRRLTLKEQREFAK